EAQHVDPGFAEYTEVAAVGVLLDQSPDLLLRQPGPPGHPRHLQLGVGHADRRVQPGRRGRHGVGRYVRLRDALPTGDDLLALLDGRDEVLVERALVGRPRDRRVGRAEHVRRAVAVGVL